MSFETPYQQICRIGFKDYISKREQWLWGITYTKREFKICEASLKRIAPEKVLTLTREFIPCLAWTSLSLCWFVFNQESALCSDEVQWEYEECLPIHYSTPRHLCWSARPKQSEQLRLKFRLNHCSSQLHTSIALF